MPDGSFPQKLSMRFEAVGLEVPDVLDHPNRHPFSGILTHIDRPSDEPPGGSGGKKVMITRKAAEAALPSLLGMAVDYRSDGKGHNAKNKIGIFTDVEIVGNDVCVKGFFYANDFPKEVTKIQAEKDDFGFSYEIEHVMVAASSTDVLEVTSFMFTGAAVLRKDAAAYHTTSIEASTENSMTPEEIAALVAAKVKEATDTLQASVATLTAANTDLTAKLAAGSASVHGLVKPHADGLRATADAMCAAGMGMHETRGHVKFLHGMADSMEADAMKGKLPHTIDTNGAYYAAALPPKKDDTETTEEEMNVKDTPEYKALQAQVDTLANTVKTLQATRVEAATADVARKTLSPTITALLVKSGIKLDASGETTTLTASVVDDLLAKGGITGRAAMAAKLSMRAGGIEITRG